MANFEHIKLPAFRILTVGSSKIIYSPSTGRHVTDVSNAAATGIFDPFLMTWSNLMMSILKIPRAMFPEVVDTSGDFGVTQKDILGVEIPIYCSVSFTTFP